MLICLIYCSKLSIKTYVLTIVKKCRLIAIPIENIMITIHSYLKICKHQKHKLWEYEGSPPRLGPYLPCYTKSTALKFQKWIILRSLKKLHSIVSMLHKTNESIIGRKPFSSSLKIKLLNFSLFLVLNRDF